MNMQDEALGKDLHHLAELLHKYGHYGQADVVDQIIPTLETPTPDYERLVGVEMWGGAGAVWEFRVGGNGAVVHAAGFDLWDEFMDEYPGGGVELDQFCLAELRDERGDDELAGCVQFQ